MMRELNHWADSELPEALQRALGSPEPSELDEAAIERMSMRLQKSLGADFDARPAELLLVSSRLWRFVATGLGTFAAVGVMWGLVSFHSRTQRANDVQLVASVSAPRRATAATPATNDPRSQQRVRVSEAAIAETHPPAKDIEPMRAAVPRLPAERHAANKLRVQRAETMRTARRPSASAANDPDTTGKQALHAAPPGRGNGHVAEARIEPAHAEGALGLRLAPAAHSGGQVSAAPAVPSLADELRGLAQIRALLTHVPERALAAADEQQQRFARGVLGPERELLRLDALVRLGRVKEARTCAAQLQAVPENHPYRARIAALLQR